MYHLHLDLLKKYEDVLLFVLPFVLIFEVLNGIYSLYLEKNLFHL